MQIGKTRLVVEVPKRLLAEFDKDVEKSGTTRTWKINKLISDYLLAKEESPTYFHDRSVQNGEGKRPTTTQRR